MNDPIRVIDLEPYLAAMTAIDNQKRAAAVEFAKSELPKAALVVLAKRLTERYRRTTSQAVRDAVAKSLVNLGEPAICPVLQAIHRSRRDGVRFGLVLLIRELKPVIPFFEQHRIADSLAAIAETTSNERLKTACGFVHTVLTED